MARIAGLDLLRGGVMVVMLLDHARDFLHRDGLTGDPTDPATTTTALYFTRWITHFCAPVFVLLAGWSARIAQSRRPGGRDLIGRGLFLIALELLVLRPLIWFSLDFSFAAHLQVIWAIGAALVSLGLLLRIRVPARVIGALGLLLVAGHNLLPWERFAFSTFPSWESLGMVLHQRGALALFTEGGPVAIVQYPLVPWLGVLWCGFALGGVESLDDASRRRRLVVLGAGATALFLVLRGANGYGDPGPWSRHPDAMQTLFSFLRVEKYPPSLHYLLMTLGPALVLLGVLGRGAAGTGPGLLRAPCRLLAALGRVPLCFYVLQWPAVHLCAWLFQWIAGQPIGWEAVNPLTLGNELPPGLGFTLPVVWVGWLLCLLVLAPVCLAFGRLQQRHPGRPWLRWL
jgi:uncharacterized membrane protein